MARKNAETNSLSSSERAVALMLTLIATSFRRDPRKLPPSGDNPRHRKRQRKEPFPAQPHQLVVAVARHDRLRHRKHEEHEKYLEPEPDDSGYPGERRQRDRRQPAAHEQDRGQRAHGGDRDIFAEHE